MILSEIATYEMAERHQRELSWLDKKLHCSNLTWDPITKKWSASYVEVSNDASNKRLPPSIKFRDVQTFKMQDVICSANQIPQHSDHIHTILHSGVFKPVIANYIILQIISGSIDCSQLSSPIDLTLWMQQAIDVEAVLNNCVLKNINTLTLYCPNEPIDLTSVISLNAKHIRIEDSKILKVNIPNIEYVRCQYTGNPLDLCDESVPATSDFKHSPWHSIAREFYGTGDKLAMQDALLDAGFI